MVINNKREIENSVERFIGFFRNKLEAIEATDFKESKRLFEKILYMGLLDALSGTTTYSKRSKNRERIVSFIKHFAKWPHQERISLPHLVGFLQKVPDPEFSSLRDYAFSLIDQWPWGEIISLDKDPTLADVKKLWPSSLSKPFDDIGLDYLQHLNLFYRYRNSLVHEFREPGYGMEMENDSEPFYHHMTDLDTDAETWELVYPLGFYRRICREAIENLREYYVNQRLDPYSLSRFGTYWIDELND